MRGKHIVDLKTAIELYWSKVELENEDIARLFGASKSTVLKFKKMVQEEMVKQGVLPWSSTAVVTEVAYKVWNIDINDLERRYKRLQKYS